MSGSLADLAPAPAVPAIAATTHVSSEGWRVTLATENVLGHMPLTYGPFETEEPARRIADAMNKRFGLTREQALLIVLSSMHPLPERDHAARKAAWPKRLPHRRAR